MKWITRKDIKVDRVACPWLIRRFIDADAEFLFVEENQLLDVAARERAIPFDAPRLSAVKLNHRGERCTFEAIIEDYNLKQGGFPEVRLVESYKPTIIGTVSIGVRKTDSELLQKINASLAKLKANGAVDKILDKWGLKAKDA